MNGKTFLFLCGVAVAVYFAFFHVSPVEHDAYQAALAGVTDTDRMVLVNFSGSDWCGACMRLDAEVFAQPEFRKYALENLEMVVVDFPRTKSLSPEIQAQNVRLREKFRVQAYPTSVLVNARGREVARMVGYLPGGPKPFIDWVEAER
jgi:thioredoxin-related protein